MITGCQFPEERHVPLGALLVRSDGASVSLLARKVELNRGADAGRQEIDSKTSSFSTIAPSLGASSGVVLGLDDFGGSPSYGSDVRGFFQWQQGF